MELRFKLLSEMEEKLKDDGGHSHDSAFVCCLHAVML